MTLDCIVKPPHKESFMNQKSTKYLGLILFCSSLFSVWYSLEFQWNIVETVITAIIPVAFGWRVEVFRPCCFLMFVREYTNSDSLSLPESKGVSFSTINYWIYEWGCPPPQQNAFSGDALTSQKRRPAGSSLPVPSSFQGQMGGLHAGTATKRCNKIIV